MLQWDWSQPSRLGGPQLPGGGSHHCRCLWMHLPAQKSLPMIVSPEKGSPVSPHSWRHECHIPLPLAQHPFGNSGRSAAEDPQSGLHRFQQDIHAHQTLDTRRHGRKSRSHPEASCWQDSRWYVHGCFRRSRGERWSYFVGGLVEDRKLGVVVEWHAHAVRGVKTDSERVKRAAISQPAASSQLSVYSPMLNTASSADGTFTADVWVPLFKYP